MPCTGRRTRRREAPAPVGPGPPSPGIIGHALNAGGGTALELAIPNLAALSGGRFHLQEIVIDPAYAGLFGGSPGILVVIG